MTEFLFSLGLATLGIVGLFGFVVLAAFTVTSFQDLDGKPLAACLVMWVFVIGTAIYLTRLS